MHITETEIKTPELSPRVKAFLAHPLTNFESATQRDAFIVGRLAGFTQPELQQLVVSSTAALSDELTQVHFGAKWQNYLRLHQIGRLLPETDATDDEANNRHQQLHSILQSYDRVVRDKQFDVITGRHNFALLHHGLAEYLAGDEGRAERAQTYQSAAQLIDALQPVPTGHHWYDYFQLHDVARLFASPRPLSR